MKLQQLFWGLAITATVASAQIPQSILFQGTLSQNGTAVQGKKKIVVNFCTASEVGVNTGCLTVFADSVQVNRGYYAVNLPGAGMALPAFDKQWYVDVASNNISGDVRIPLTATPYSLRSLLADSSLKASIAQAAVHAILADSSLKSAFAALAAKALLADSATGALRAVSAANATNAAYAANAVLADSSAKSGFAVKMTGISVDVDTIKVAKNKLEFTSGAEADLESRYISGSNKKSAGVYMNPVSNSVLIATQYSTGVSGGGAGILIAMDSVTTSVPVRSTAGFRTDGDFSGNIVKLAPTTTANLPVCDASLRGALMFGDSHYHPSLNEYKDRLLVCRRYSFPAAGSPSYNWVEVGND